ncbi:MAG: UDP-3-O-(3-hydroxymyristoyl)glucosamine N-acyltransferase [Clostridia bacterium]
MKLSECFKIEGKKLINEQEFDTLGILASKTEKNICTFIDDDKYISDIKDNFTMLITTQELYEKLKDRKCGFYITEFPRIEFFNIHNKLCSNSNYVRKSFETKVGKSCNISKLACIAEKNVIIGNNVIIEEFVSIKENVVIGDNTIIRAGSIIGGCGFEFKRNKDKIMPVNHVGGVKIENNVEIQYNTTIDKAIYPWDDTIIGEYTKIDNLNHIGHACKIGRCVMLPAASIIGGRTVIEDNVWIGIGCTVRNGITIGKNARCNMGAVVTRNVEENTSVTGNFAIDHETFINNVKKWSMGV